MIVYLDNFDQDLKQRPKPVDDGECNVNDPKMAELFSLVKYGSLNRYIMIYIYSGI